MHGIIGMTELVLATQLSSDQRDYIETVRSSAEDLIRVVDDTLDFSKMDAGHLSIENAPFDLERIVQTAIRTLSFKVQTKDLELSSAIAPSIPTRISGDAARVMQVCSQQVISRIMRPHDQLFHWGGAGLLGILQRDENVQGVRSELMRVLATPVNQYFETEHRAIYLPIRMSGELFAVTGTLDSLQEQIQKYVDTRA